MECSISISDGGPSFGDLGPAGVLRKFAGAGWRYFEINLSSGKFMECEPSRIKRLCKELGVSVPQIHGCNPGMARKSPHERRKFMDRAKASLLWAAEIGARWVVLHPSNREEGSRTPEDYEEVKKMNLEGFQELLETARSAGVGIAVENLPPQLHDSVEGEVIFGADPSELLWLVEETGHEGMGVCLDTNHIFAGVQGMDQYKVIKLLGSHLVATHISDNDGFREQHLLPFMGSIDWKAVMRGLCETGYTGPFNLEVKLKAPFSVRDELVRYALRLLEEMVMACEEKNLGG